MRRTLAIARKEVKELLRQPLFLGLAFLVPLVMFVVFGYGITLDIKNMPLGVLDLDRTTLSRDLVERFSGEYFDLKGYISDIKDADVMLKRGRLRAVLYIPPDFTGDIYRKGRAEVQVLIDGGYPYTASTIRGYAEAIVEALNMELAERKGLKARPPIDIRTRFFFNESVKTSNALVPGLLVVIMMVNPAVLVATAIAREKEFGTIYNIYSSPVSKMQYLAGKLLPYVVVSFMNLLILVGLVKVLFGISMKGNLLVMLPHGLVYVLINILIGLLISLMTRTVVAAQIITLIVTTIPAFLYSGLLIPVSHLGPEGQVMARLYPAMYFMKVVHGVYLKKLGFWELLPELLRLGLYFIALVCLSYIFFKKREG